MGTIDNINDLNKSDFLSIFGNVFEKTESVAQEAFESKPFKDFDDIVFKMLDIYENYKKEKILEILNAHPELAIAKKMTSESISEQASAKLNECSDDEYEEFKKLNFERGTLLLFSIILILPAIYAYSRDIPETRYLYILFPIFTIFSLYTIEKISREKNFKLIASLIILGIIVSSVGWVEYKWIDKEYEKEAFELSFKIKESTNGINQFYPESTYLKFIDTEKKFPKLKNEVFEQHKIFPITEYQNIEELLLNEQKNGLTHIITDKSQNSKNQRPEFLIDIFFIFLALALVLELLLLELFGLDDVLTPPNTVNGIYPPCCAINFL